MKRGQVTIFIIVALVIVGAILAFFFLRNNTDLITTTFSPTENPKHYIAICSEEALQQGIGLLMPQGGFIDPINYADFGGEKIGYVCYTSEDNKKCVNKVPLYVKHLELEFKEFVTPKIEECFRELEDDFQSKGLFVDMDDSMNVDIDILPGNIEVKINREFNYDDDTGAQSYNEFNAFLESRLYEVSETVETLITHEVRACDFDHNSYMMFNDGMEITKIRGPEESKIYTIFDEYSMITTKVAIRGCVWELTN